MAADGGHFIGTRSELAASGRAARMKNQRRNPNARIPGLRPSGEAGPECARPGRSNVGKQPSAETPQPATPRSLLHPGTGALRRQCQDAPNRNSEIRDPREARNPKSLLDAWPMGNAIEGAFPIFGFRI